MALEDVGGPMCSLTRGVDVKLFVLYLSDSLFSPQ